MAFEPTPFISATIQALRSHGFIQSAGTIENLIRYGVRHPDTDELTNVHPAAQNELAALVIEQNIIEPYRAWEETVQIIGRSNEIAFDDANVDELLMIRDGRSLAILGSVGYRNAIAGLEGIVGYLRGGPPPAPRGGGGGGPPGGPGSGRGPSESARETTPLLTSSPQMPLSMNDPIRDPRSVDYSEINVSDSDEHATEHVQTVRLWQ